MKKSVLLLVIILASFSSCSKKSTPNKDKAKQMFDLVWNLYRVPSYGLFSEYYPSSYRPDLTYFNDSTRTAQEVSYLWPMSGVFSSAVLMAEINPEKYSCYIDSMVVAEEQYYDTLRVPFGYQAYPERFGKVDRYYDDNGLVGIDYVDSYFVTGNSHYLEKAKQILSFIISGWDDRFDGAVPWLEGVKDQKPACSNGKAMVLALKLYKATNDEYYLETGKRFYRWINKYLRDPERCVVYNSLSTISGSPCYDLYTYNTGTLIQAAVALYSFTDDKSYLDNANALAEGSYKTFFKHQDDGTPYINDLPWFNLVLFRGYHSLFDVTGDSKYVDAIIQSLDYAWQNARDKKGLFYKDWSGNTDESTQPKWLLDEACIAEFYARTAIIKGEVRQK